MLIAATETESEVAAAAAAAVTLGGKASLTMCMDNPQLVCISFMLYISKIEPKCNPLVINTALWV